LPSAHGNEWPDEERLLLRIVEYFLHLDTLPVTL